MQTKDTFCLGDNKISPAPDPTPAQNTNEVLESILLKMIFRISQEEPNVTKDVGHVA